MIGAGGNADCRMQTAEGRSGEEGIRVKSEARSQEPRVREKKSDEELLEAIDPNGRLVRVNLRPMLGPWGQSPCGDSPRGAVEWLAEAMVESARRVKGDPVEMKRRLSSAVRWCRTNLPRQAAGLERMAAQAGESGFPAFHHSPAYNRAYRPAYSVVLSGCLKPRASGRAG